MHGKHGIVGRSEGLFVMQVLILKQQTSEATVSLGNTHVGMPSFLSS